MTLHFTSVRSLPSSESSTADSNLSLRSPVQTKITSMATSKEANHAELLWAQGLVAVSASNHNSILQALLKNIDIKKMGVSALDSHTKSKNQKNTAATLVSATPINTHFAGMIKSQFLYI